MSFRKEFFSINFFRNKFFVGTLFRKFSFHEKICFWNFSISNYFFSKEIIFQNLNFFRKKNVAFYFMRFRRKRLEKQTHIDKFSLKKNPKRIYLASLYLLMPQYTINEISKNKKNRK